MYISHATMYTANYNFRYQFLHKNFKCVLSFQLIDFFEKLRLLYVRLDPHDHEQNKINISEKTRKTIKTRLLSYCFSSDAYFCTSSASKYPFKEARDAGRYLTDTRYKR